MNLLEEAWEFKARKDRKSNPPPIKVVDTNLKQVTQTLKKLEYTREGIWTEKIITSDSKRSEMMTELLKEIDEKIVDYTRQRTILTERNNGPHYSKRRSYDETRQLQVSSA